ncbi:RnfABCDGE type electron transport complex subunit D, partial [bacterium]|nr:RnfABCDGE type electron transport complex subunit D [bacterium]
SPHIRAREDVRAIMSDVIFALSPALVASIIFFGWRALLIVSVSIFFSVASEFFWQKLWRKKITVGDLSSVVTGMLLAFVLPPSSPLWMVAIGAFVAITLGKQIFGGLGYNPFNPALVARAVLLASWPVYMTTWTRPFDGVTTASPLGIVKMELDQRLPSYLEMFLGNRAGCLGEISVLALLLGVAYLLYKKQITWHIPVSFIGTVGLVCLLFNRDPLFNIMAGGLILGAFFMATDLVTSPLTKKGKLVFGVGCGLLTVLIRFTGGFPEGVCYSILIMNMLTPIIDKITEPKVFGS